MSPKVPFCRWAIMKFAMSGAVELMPPAGPMVRIMSPVGWFSLLPKVYPCASREARSGGRFSRMLVLYIPSGERMFTCRYCSKGVPDTSSTTTAARVVP